jgi:hypothetical protein
MLLRELLPEGCEDATHVLVGEDVTVGNQRR